MLLSPREIDRLKKRYKNMTAKNFFEERNSLIKKSQELLDKNKWDQYEKNEKKLNVWTDTLQEMDMGLQQTTSKFKKGDPVRHLDRLGIVEHVHRDGSYTIRHAKGDRDKHILQQHIQKLSVAHRFRVGDKVMAHFGGDLHAFPGKIKKANKDGTYNIKYDDGDSEKNVPANKITTIQHANNPISGSISPSSSSSLSSKSSSSSRAIPISDETRIQTPPSRRSRNLRIQRTCQKKKDKCLLM